jgi:predicted nucleotidyltransferase
VDIKVQLQTNKHYLQETYHVTEIAIFGSCARNEQRKRSDADILVEFEKGHKDFFNYMRLKYYLEGLLQKKVDLVMKGAIKRQLKTSILAEAQYV